MKIHHAIIGAVILAAGGVYLNNASWLAPAPDRLELMAHRGVYQQFSREGLTNETCTAAQSLPSGHSYLENTLASMAAAFEYGADIVEFDIHATSDGDFIVFHDWTLECRTNGSGRTRDHSVDKLKQLDIAYGYTFDGGETFPLRGSGYGLMPTLGEVLETFPERRFLVDIKSNQASEADRLHAWLEAHPGANPDRLMVIAGPRAAERLNALRPDMTAFSKQQVMTCMRRYMLLGWSGYVPRACHDGFAGAPVNMTWMLWGWPNRFIARMEAVNTPVFIGGETDITRPQNVGLDDPASLGALRRNFRGGIITDRIELIGPAVRERWPDNPPADARAD
ncbi:glycerophosphodiester phosphodiesterase [Alkalicaulis satelles]|uniref:Glycerophosphodiester phosphodiesterase n=1 Tax=Alkalicaulis satelles TaxID=2609175 RepID=A0A5M6ZPR3_9PROT|nr:glycerophosphodiester phosphodiesterase family protein [Alkalicaulis satelles]KAA5805238.1 glycerophosphodiester phosphodiesterase [Alkalicaulis satelles]